ncbi:MAG: cyclic nucleotide-binding domain-containing protein [Acidobacteriota bacterium]
MSSPLEISENPVPPSALSRLDLFSDVPASALEELARGAVELRVKTNQVVIHEGDDVGAFFVVLEGALAVYRDAVGQPVQLLARLHAGSHFGEIALFGSGRATASVRASERSRVVRIAKASFFAFLEDFPHLQLNLQMSAARRHSEDLASVLETGRRREVRIRCNRPVPVETADGARREMGLENLSLGGVCLSRAPESWRPGEAISFGLVLREGALALSGSVRWRRGDTVGIAFDKRSPRHDMLVQMAIRLILESIL